MNKYIQSLKDQNKLNLSIDKLTKFNWEYTKIAGPCSVEGESIIEIAKEIKKCGANALRAGAYKPCTFPIIDENNGWKEGLREKGLELLIEAKKQSGLPIVTEVMDVRKIESIGDVADVFQVGTRNFQNYSLLDELGKTDKPILLKRGTWGTLDEILGAAERILVGGNNNIAICLRGVVGMPSYRHIYQSVRWAPDLMMILALKQFTNIPIIYDPSHACGNRDFVPGISKAAKALGCDGLIIEAHPDPVNSISDPDQAINYETLKQIFDD
ncbi:MAG: 3-deoxy-7-phosphoheptulonate synthase [Pelagibacterales bacterium]|nr:3-deoxy-7-phosphoheptulonate synthase [Pelagibacterales bacterium]|tara:strand:+ start:8801 stop:9610 length:810 start_codon:yes stop_codon:yes gene_type:complete